MIRDYDNIEPPKPRKTEANTDIKQFYDKHKRSNMNKLKRVVNWIVGTVAGETKVGEGVHGVFDLLPIPNQIIAKAFSYFSKGKTSQAKEELRKLLSVRNGIALIAFFLFVTGVISIDELERLLEQVR